MVDDMLRLKLTIYFARFFAGFMDSDVSILDIKVLSDGFWIRKISVLKLNRLIERRRLSLPAVETLKRLPILLRIPMAVERENEVRPALAGGHAADPPDLTLQIGKRGILRIYGSASVEIVLHLFCDAVDARNEILPTASWNVAASRSQDGLTEDLFPGSA